MAKKKTQNPKHQWKVGTWYVNPMGYLINYQRGTHSYGIIGTNFDGGNVNLVNETGWRTRLRVTPEVLEANEFIEAERKDVLKRLHIEASERGFVIGATYFSLISGLQEEISGSIKWGLTDDEQQLYAEDKNGEFHVIFNKGNWAEVVGGNKKHILDFNDGVIGRDIEHVADTIFDLYYTQPVPELGITLSLGIWGGTTISYSLGFMYGGKKNNKFKYVLSSVSKEGWDKKSEVWFNGFITEAFNKFIKTTHILSGTTGTIEGTKIKGGDSITINFDSSSLFGALNDLTQNFLWYNKIGLTNTSQEVGYNYGIMSQDELNTLLQVYTMLDIKGNKDAKEEIAIIKTFIKTN